MLPGCTSPGSIILFGMENSQFNRHWKNYSNAIESLLIRKVAGKNYRIEEINQGIKSLSQRWFRESSIEGAWLAELTSQKPVQAQKIKSILGGIFLHKEDVALPSMVGYYLLVVAIAMISIGICALLPIVTWKKILVPILCVMLAYGFLIPAGKSKKNKTQKETVSLYMKQINLAKTEIEKVLNEGE